MTGFIWTMKLHKARIFKYITYNVVTLCWKRITGLQLVKKPII